MKSKEVLTEMFNIGNDNVVLSEEALFEALYLESKYSDKKKSDLQGRFSIDSVISRKSINWPLTILLSTAGNPYTVINNHEDSTTTQAFGVISRKKHYIYSRFVRTDPQVTKLNNKIKEQIFNDAPKKEIRATYNEMRTRIMQILKDNKDEIKEQMKGYKSTIKAAKQAS